MNDSGILLKAFPPLYSPPSLSSSHLTPWSHLQISAYLENQMHIKSNADNTGKLVLRWTELCN